MKYYIGGTNDGGCLNYGYRRLNSHGSHVWISSGAGGYGYGYNNYERCYWAIYAPGAQRLELRLSSFNVGFSGFPPIRFYLQGSKNETSGNFRHLIQTTFE